MMDMKVFLFFLLSFFCFHSFLSFFPLLFCIFKLFSFPTTLIFLIRSYSWKEKENLIFSIDENEVLIEIDLLFLVYKKQFA